VFVGLIEFNAQMMITIMATSTELKAQLDANGGADLTATVPENRSVVTIPKRVFDEAIMNATLAHD
jgi:predicted HTH transcriptional regulator